MVNEVGFVVSQWLEYDMVPFGDERMNKLSQK